ncbi:hypothetical protein AB0N07_43115 [Streptomyces sp. NPDC051172]|uniref:hypothetical protein n=1 Tax=Streptomyces sp. NPDC051172 TaxID=3155796 RepID=UPI0034440EE8
MKEAVQAALQHMHGGRSPKRRGGRELVRLLEEVRGTAAGAGEWQVVRLVHDAIEYAEGRITRYDFEDRYRLFGDGRLRESHSGFLGSTMKAMHQWIFDSGREFLADRPEAGIEEFLEHFRAQGEDAQFLEAPEDRPGRYVIPRGRAETMLWLERIQRSRRIDVVDAATEARKIVSSPEALALLAADDRGRSSCAPLNCADVRPGSGSCVPPSRIAQRRRRMSSGRWRGSTGSSAGGSWVRRRTGDSCRGTKSTFP